MEARKIESLLAGHMASGEASQDLNSGVRLEARAASGVGMCAVCVEDAYSEVPTKTAGERMLVKDLGDKV